MDKPYLSAVRIPGKLLILPGLFEPEQRPNRINANAARTVVISRIVINNEALELFDKTLRQPPLKIRLEEIQSRSPRCRAGKLFGSNAI